MSVAVVGAVRLITLTAGVTTVVPALGLFTTTAAADTLAALAVTLLLATVAATAVLAAAAWALAFVCAAVVLALAVGAVGACVTSSSSLVLVVAVFVVVVLLLVLDPFELTRPATMIAPPVTLIDPVDPPVVVIAPLTVTAWAVAVIWLAEVVLPAARDKAAELVTKLPPSLVLIMPLLVMVPVAFNVRVVAAPLVGAIAAPAATVRSPLTSMVTLEVAKADEIALAVELVMTKSSGSRSQWPALPSLAVTSTTVDLRISRMPEELVST